MIFLEGGWAWGGVLLASYHGGVILYLEGEIMPTNRLCSRELGGVGQLMCRGPSAGILGGGVLGTTWLFKPEA